MDGSEAPIELDPGWRDEPLGLSRLFGMARRNAWLIGLGFVLGIGLGLVYIVFAQPIYTASATVRVDLENGGSTDVLTGMQLDNHVALIQSDETTGAVIRKLGLDEIFDATPGRLRRVILAARAWLGLDDALEDGSGRSMADTRSDPATSDAPPDPESDALADVQGDAPDDARDDALAAAQATDTEAEIIRLVGSALSVERLGNTAMISVSYLSSSRPLSVEIANSYASTYVEAAQAAAAASNENRIQRLRERMEDVRARADSAYETVRRLRFQDGISVSDPSDLGRQVASLKERLAAAELEVETTRTRLGVLSEIGDVAILPIGARQTERIAELHGNLATTLRRLALLRSRDGASVTAVAQLDGVAAELRDSLTQELRQLADTLELRLATTATARDELAAELRQLMDYGRSAAWAQLLDAEREAGVYQEMYDGYRKDLETIYLQPAARSEVSVSSKALMPVSPSFPRYKPILALAGALGIALALGFAMYREWTR